MSMDEEKLEQQFETDRRFVEEGVPAALGRVIWLAARHRAEYILYLRKNLELDPDTTAKIALGFASLQREFIDTIMVGLSTEEHENPDIPFYDRDRTKHPLEGRMMSITNHLMGISGDSIEALALGDQSDGYDFYADLGLGDEALDKALRAGSDLFADEDGYEELSTPFAKHDSRELLDIVEELDPPTTII